jgi:hypothetical protein
MSSPKNIDVKNDRKYHASFPAMWFGSTQTRYQVALKSDLKLNTEKRNTKGSKSYI